jgi:hypothetical protein
MMETVEICLAGQSFSTGLGGSVSIPYLPWGPDQIRNLTEDDRTEILKALREIRGQIISQATKS